MILPAGTKIVTLSPIAGTRDVHPAGSLGVVVTPPADSTHSYRVRMPGGHEVGLTRDQFRLLREVQDEGLAQARSALDQHELERHVIYRCLVGSRAYGLANDDSDRDVRGVYLAPAERHWSLYGVPEQLENKETDEVYWELQKFLLLALKANPNILEVLYTPEVLAADELAHELRGMRKSFLSKLVFQTYGGYVQAQFRKLEARRAKGLAIKWKHAMHLIRLLLAGTATLRKGEVPVRVADQHRERLLEIRVGAIALDSIVEWHRELYSDFAEAYRRTVLPDRPDYERVNDFLVRARRHAAGSGLDS